MRVRGPFHRSPLSVILTSAIVCLALSAAVTGDPAASQSSRVLTSNDSSQAVAVSMHFDVPAGARNHGPGFGRGPQDESGSMVITGQTVDAGSPADPYIVAFDNAASIAGGESASVKSGDSWQTSIQMVDASGSVNAINVMTVVSSASDGAIQIHATGSGSKTFSTPRGDRTADVTVDITESITGDRLTEYEQKFSRSMKGRMGSFTTSATTALKST